jgi:exosortase
MNTPDDNPKKRNPVSTGIPAFLRDPVAVAKISTCVVCFGILYYSVFQSMVYAWSNDPNFSHGFLIPFISLFLVWQRSQELEQLPAAPCNPGILVIITGLFFLMVGNLAAEYFIQRISFIVVLCGIILFLFGRQHLKLLSFPLIYLIFMIPLPSILMLKITFPMQMLAAKAATYSLQLLDITVFREGTVVHLAENSLEVERACSGIRSLISLLALGAVLAYFVNRLNWQRAVVVFSCIPIAILINAFRVSMTGILANYYGIEAAEGFLHGFSGAVLYFAGLLLVAVVAVFLSKIYKAQGSGRRAQGAR